DFAALGTVSLPPPARARADPPRPLVPARPVLLAQLAYDLPLLRPSRPALETRAGTEEGYGLGRVAKGGRHAPRRGGAMTARARVPLWPALVVLAALTGLQGCEQPQGGGGGPGGRRQNLALTPEQELELGTKAYAEELKGKRLAGGRALEQVRRVGKR